MISRVCLLTGAAGILGTAVIKAFLPAYRVVAVYHKNLPFQSMEGEIIFDPLNMEDTYPHEFIPFSVQGDIARDEDIARIVDAALWHFGRIDLLINAAVFYEFGNSSDTAFLKSADHQFHINLFSPIRLAARILEVSWRHSIQENRKRRSNIVNVSSVSGLRPMYGSGQALYGAAKAALNHISYHMAEEYRPYGVRVNCLCPTTFPGRVPTEQVVEAIRALDVSEDSGSVLSVE